MQDDGGQDRGGEEDAPLWQRVFLFFVVRYEVVALVVLVVLAIILLVLNGQVPLPSRRPRLYDRRRP